MIKKIFSLAGLLCLGLLASCGSAIAAEPANMGADLDLLQFSPPQPGDTLVVLHTNMGDITIRLFPEEAPMAYENFVTHARNGYYDGLIFHRVIEDFMLQGGCPLGTGTGGGSIWGHGFGAEFSMHLRHFRGALAMAHAGPGTNGSQFYIVQNTDHSRFASPQVMQTFEYALENQDEPFGEDMDGNMIYLRDLLHSDMVEAYRRYGGTPHLDLVFNESGHTVFGQVISGMNVVDAIAAVDTDGDPPAGRNRPVRDVVIESVTVTEA